LEDRSWRGRCVNVEVHFGKPVVAKVRKCRMVVIRNKRSQESGDIPEQKS